MFLCIFEPVERLAIYKTWTSYDSIYWATDEEFEKAQSSLLLSEEERIKESENKSLVS